MLLKFKSFSFIGKLIKFWPIIVLFLISLFVCFINYTPGTWLSGWDTLHPEFNFGLNFERTINGVFRVEQGFGAVAGHSHMADLPRILILYISSFLLPLSFLRFFYIDLCIVFGTLGMYFLLKKHFFKQRTISFLGALFYLLNLGTVQTFNVPFEMFTTLFASLPFIFLFATSYLIENKNNSKYLLLFAVTILFTSPSAYAATLWYIFFLCFGLYFFIYALINHKSDKKSLVKFLILIAVTIAINLYWLVPSIYFIFTHGAEVAKANINMLFSDQAFLKNKEFGNIRDILLLKSFYFDWKIYASNNQFTDLLFAYINHLKSPLVLFTGYLFSFGIIIGSIFYAFKLKLKSLPLFSVILVCLLFLFNDNLPFSPIYNLFQNHIPFFKEALRFPDDKILNVFVFFVTILFSYSLLFVVEKLKKIHHKIQPEVILTLIMSVLIIYYSLPTFSGNFINKYMRIQIPKTYFQLFDYLNTQPQSMRVSNFPVHSPWGWAYYDWYQGSKPSFQGAGFLYFGIKQPLLDRDFDRWNGFNESYYREVSYAIYKQDKKLLAGVLNKYKIGFIFIDKSVINPQSSSLPLYFQQSENLLKETNLVTNKKTFGEIDIYKLSSGGNYISSVNTKTNISPTTTTTNNDFAFAQFGDYLSFYNSSSDISQIVYPFRDLINNQAKLHSEIVSEGSNNIFLTPNLKSSSFQIGFIANNLKTINADLVASLSGNSLTLTFNPIVPILNTLSLSLSKSQKLSIPQTSNNLYLSINAKDLISLKNLPQNSPVLVGKAQLENDNNTISVFDKSNGISVVNAGKIINPFFSSCNQNSESPTAGILTNGLTLTGKGDLCILIPFGFLPKIDGQVVLIDFQFNFTGLADISSCLYNVQTASCTSYKSPAISDNKISFEYPFYTQDKQKMAIKIFIKPNNTTQNTFLFTNINASYTKSVSSVNLTKDFINKMFIGDKTVAFDKLIFSKNNIYKPEVEIIKTHLINDCIARNAKKEIVQVGKDKVIKYTSIEGSFCDYFAYPNLVHNQGYLIAISSNNDSGLPLTLCVSNYTTRKCDIYSNLASFKTPGKDYFLLPPMDAEGVGYDLNFENIGIKGTTSVNYLSSIEIMPIPYEFISNIKTQTFASQNINLNGKIVKVENYRPSTYVIQTSAPTLLTLNQSFEGGFKAYSVNCSFGISCMLKGLFAPLLSTQIKDHILINNWANGWIIDKSSLNTSNSKIIIIYLPQYLEGFGFLVLLLTFLFLLLYIKVEKHH